MANVKFYRGVKDNYRPSGAHADGLYYATDTHEVFMNGVSYGNVADLRLQKATSGAGTQESPYVWKNATTLYWGGHYRFATSGTEGNDGVITGAVTAFEFDTPAAKSGGYLAFDSNGTNLDIASGKIADGDTSAKDHDKLATKGYVDDLITGLNNAIVSVAGNGGTSGAAGGTTVTLTNTSGTTYSGRIYFTEKDGGSQPIDIQFNAADFVQDSYLNGVEYYPTAPDPSPAGDPGHDDITFPALYFKFRTYTGGAANLWVSVADLVDTYTAGNGLELSQTGAFSVKPKTNGGITVDSTGVSVATSDGLQVGAAGVSVKAKTNSGIAVTSDGVAVKLETDGGIAFDSNNGGLEITPKTNGGIEVDNSGVAVKTGAGLQTGADGVSVKLHKNSGTDDSGLTATSADGLTVNTTGYVTKSGNAIALDTSKIEGYASTEATAGDNNLASKKYVDSQLAAGLIWYDVN